MDNPVRDCSVQLPLISSCITVFLFVYYQDIERCLQALEELEAVPVTSQILQRNAEVIATLKKVCLPSLAPSFCFSHYAHLEFLLFVDNLDPAV